MSTRPCGKVIAGVVISRYQSFNHRSKGNENAGGGPKQNLGGTNPNPSKVQSGEQPKHTPGERSEGKPQNKYAQLTCHYCHKEGHVRAQCYQRIRAEGQRTESGVLHCLSEKPADLINPQYGRKVMTPRSILCLTHTGVWLR